MASVSAAAFTSLSVTTSAAAVASVTGIFSFSFEGLAIAKHYTIASGATPYGTEQVVFDGAVSLPVVPPRPVVTLPSDGLRESYFAGTLDCLNNSNPYSQGCWNVLKLNEWLPTWVSLKPYCIWKVRGD